MEDGDGHCRNLGSSECIVRKRSRFDLSFLASEQAALSDGVSWHVFAVYAFPVDGKAG